MDESIEIDGDREREMGYMGDILGRFLVLIWGMSCLFINMAYNSNLRSQLLKPSNEAPINTVQDVLERGENIWILHQMIDPETPYIVDHQMRDLLKSELKVRKLIPIYVVIICTFVFFRL